MTAFPDWLIVRLKKIACFDDKLANHHLETTGSYSCFDEPGSVRIARDILAEMESRAPTIPHVRNSEESA